MKPLFIIGYMCSGKTTFGEALARAANLKFIDLDQYIEAREGCSVSDLFKKIGEEGFREIERDSLREVSEMENCVIACGGGTPCFFDNIDVINSSGRSVFLETSPETLLRRLKEEHHKRPLVANRSSEEIRKIIEEQLSRRNPYYHRASIIFSGENLDTSAQISQTVKSFLKYL